MSETAVILRQGNVCRSSSIAQKRPLSIIKENDNDDTDIIDCTKYQENVDDTDKENVSSPNLESTFKNGDDFMNVSESIVIPKCAKAVLENTSSVKSQGIVIKPNFSGTCTAEQSSNSTIQTCTVNSPHVVVSSMDGKSGEASFVIHLKGNTFPSVVCSKESEEANTFPEVSISENLNSQILSSSLEAIQKDTPASSTNTQSNKTVTSRLNIDVQSSPRAREKPERHHISFPCSPVSPTPFSSKFGQRLWAPALSTRTFHEIKNTTGQSFQQFSIPTNGGTPFLISLSIATSPDSDDMIDNSSKSSSEIPDSNILYPSHGNRKTKFSTSNLKPTNLSSYFSRRMSNESTGSLSESDISDGEVGSDDNPSTYLSYFRRLQETTDKLRLSTRRPSIMLWRQQYLESSNFSRARPGLNGDPSDEGLTSERIQRIDRALEWLRNQLQDMRSQDQNLARQLLALRQDIHKLKLQRSTEEHQELIDDFHYELQEHQELLDILDLPLPEYEDNPLKHIGVTRLNISARRFSAC